MLTVSKVDKRTLRATVHASTDGDKTLCGRRITGLHNRWFVFPPWEKQHAVTCEKCQAKGAK